MSKSLGTGKKYSIGELGVILAVTSITNAKPAVATIVASSPVPTVGALVALDIPGWPGITDRAFRVAAASGTSVTLEGTDTTSTDDYPAGTGVGTATLVPTWDLITQVKTAASTGGDQQTTDASDMDDEDDVLFPLGHAALTINLEVYDDPSLSWYATIEASNKVKTPVRIVNKRGNKIYGLAYFSISPVPTGGRNELETVQVTILFAKRPVRYVS